MQALGPFGRYLQKMGQRGSHEQSRGLMSKCLSAMLCVVVWWNMTSMTGGIGWAGLRCCGSEWPKQPDLFSRGIDWVLCNMSRVISHHSS